MSTDYTIRFASTTDRPLAFIHGQAVSTGRFRTDVERVAGSLSEQPFVLIGCDSRYAFCVALLAAWITDKTAILPPNNSPQSLRAIREQYPLARECDDTWADTLLTTNADETHTEWCVELAGNRIAVHLYTSGSTGAPIVAVKSIANLIDEAHTLATTFDWPAGAVVGSVAPQHMYGLTFTVMLPWIAGLPWINESPRFERDLDETLATTRAGTLISVPAQYRALLAGNLDLRAHRCVSAAAPLDAGTAQLWYRQHGAEILEIYGSTETGIVAHRHQCSDPLWQAFARVELSTDNGLLTVTSPFISNGGEYRFATADRVTIHPDRRFELLGRADAIVKIAGKRVSLTAVETCLMAYPGVNDAVALAVPSPALVRDHLILAAVACSKGGALDTRAIRKHLAEQLDTAAMPRRIVVVDRLPRNANGKAPRADVLALFDDKEQQDA